LASAPELLVLQARIHLARGELYLARQLLGQGESLFAAAGDPAGMAQVLIYQSMVNSQEGKYQSALEGCQRALELLSSPPQAGPASEAPAAIRGAREKSRQREKLTAAARRNIGVSYWGMGKLSQAQNEFERALTIYERLGDAYHMAHVHQE
jgi:tetratricopeptide (TPR) repeat protein